MRSSLGWFAALLVILAVVSVYFAQTAPPGPFGFDEADYMYASSQGFAANALDRGSLGMGTYIRKGLELMHDRSKREELSRMIRSSSDVNFYRHYHGPVYAYWLALARDLGARREVAFRASGLAVNAAGAILIFLLFLRLFPNLGPAAAFVAAATFAMNRTALVAGTVITQHVAFAFFACLALFATAEFLRTGRERFWLVAAALIAVSFAAVEIAVVLIGAICVTVIALEWRRGFKALAGLFLRGAGVFLVTLAVIWPAGVFKLNALKGYMYLAYMALERKTFTPIGPVQLWSFKIRTYPFEFVLLFLALGLGVGWLWRTKSFRSASPFLFYALAFFGVTMVITAPFTYYHASLTMAAAVVTGVVFGEISNRMGASLRWVALAAVLASLVTMDVGFYRERAHESALKPEGTADVLAYLGAHPADKKVVLPYPMVPPVHYYYPDRTTSGYDETWTGAALANQVEMGPGAVVFCVPEVCRALDLAATGAAERVGEMPDTKEPIYAMRPDGR